MIQTYRVQNVEHTDVRFDLLDIKSIRSTSELAAAVVVLGKPHGRQHLWAKVWCLAIGKAWLLDGSGNVVATQSIRPRWGSAATV